jgi:hypothetical protein
MRKFIYVVMLGLLFLLVIFPEKTHAQSPLLLSADFNQSVPLGPFQKNETIQIIGTVLNTSVDQTIVICEGSCIGGQFTYSLGALASTPDGYTFHFGTGKKRGSDIGFLNGQIAGPLLPGEAKDFVFGEYSPISKAELGTYGPFGVQLQIYAATLKRPMIGSSTLSGTWQVVQHE